jgi:hypothetical protein
MKYEQTHRLKYSIYLAGGGYYAKTSATCHWAVVQRSGTSFQRHDFKK